MILKHEQTNKNKTLESSKVRRHCVFFMYISIKKEFYSDKVKIMQNLTKLLHPTIFAYIGI